MTNGMSLEVQVANSARSWREASRGADLAARDAAERTLADSLEQWIAELLSTDAQWPQQGRWFDGLIFQECLAEDPERFHLRGYIWGIDQKQYAFRAELQPSTDGLAAFEVRIAHGKASASRSAEPEWDFQFVRGK
ncbi:hypothetical protein [Pyxidicoccus trucidator]|uniref:hypothetical protein n=1 Tax=Pyxidicoccus trucidator TaxID=2709662 RepID=UPI0013D9362D|nr:hypothetical protein [Pyxidicoccus trucidator]